MNDIPDFSSVAPEYATARPAYPPELFVWLAGTVARHDVAWDVACGSGQAAVGLATYFNHVVASDVSQRQIEHATHHPRVEYRVAPAEHSRLPDRSTDLIAVAAAIHWFDLPRFYSEARRVIRDGGVLAAWTYHVAHVDPPLDAILGPFYRDVVAPYFAPGARLVDAKYETLDLPGEALQPPSFTISVRWNAEQVLKFARTWSGVQSYIERNGRDPVVDIEGAVREALGDEPRWLRWPLYVRATRLGAAR